MHFVCLWSCVFFSQFCIATQTVIIRLGICWPLEELDLEKLWALSLSLITELFLLHASKGLFLMPSVNFLFMPQISREWLNGFSPNSQGERVSSLAWTNLKVNIKGQRSTSPGTKSALSPVDTHWQLYEWYALPANTMQQRRMTPFGPCWGGVISGACMWCMFWKISLAVV